MHYIGRKVLSANIGYIGWPGEGQHQQVNKLVFLLETKNEPSVPLELYLDE